MLDYVTLPIVVAALYVALGSYDVGHFCNDAISSGIAQLSLFRGDLLNESHKLATQLWVSDTCESFYQREAVN